MTTSSRRNIVWRSALIAIATMIPAHLAHEIISYGVIHEKIRWSYAECVSVDCVGIFDVLITNIISAFPVGLLFATAGAITAQLSSHWFILTVLWLLTLVWGLFLTAFEYRVMFALPGPDWTSSFWVNMYHPILTPLIVFSGGLVFALKFRNAI